MAKKYMGVATLTALMEILKEYLGNTVSVEDIVTSLEDYEPEEGKVAGADLVKALQEEVDQLKAGSGDAQNAETLGGHGADDFVLVENVMTALSQIIASEAVLEGKVASAQAVKDLYDSIADLVTDGAVTPEDIVTDLDGYDPGEEDDGKVAGAALVKDLQDQIEALQSQLNAFEAQKGVADGLAELDDGGKVKSEQLPSYVDDVLEGFLDEEDDTKFYEPDEDGENPTDEELPQEKGKIYVDLKTNKSYRWSGSTYVEVCSSDMVEITEEEVEKIWNDVLKELETDAAAE